MGYYSDVALCLTKNGMDQLKTALAEAEKNNPDNFAAIKMLIAGEPSKIDEGTGAVVFLWKGESGTMNLLKWLLWKRSWTACPAKTSCSSVLAKIMTTLKLAVAFVASRLGCMWKEKLHLHDYCG